MFNHAFSQEHDKKDLLTFELTVQNPNEQSVALVEIGVVNSPEPRPWQSCKDFHRIPSPLADYELKFRVSEKGRFEEAVSPPLILRPKETRTISVALMPDSNGLCDYWLTHVSIFLRFSDGSEITSSRQDLTKSDVEEHAQNTPEDERILSYLRHPRAELRAQGIKYLINSNMDIAAKAALLRHKLTDSEDIVRVSAVEAAGKLRILSLAHDIEKIVEATPEDDSEITTYLIALARISSPSSTNLLSGRLDECNFYPDCFTVADQIALSGRSDLLAILRRKIECFLSDGEDCKKAGDPKLSLSALIRAEDDSSIPCITKILTDKKYADEEEKYGDLQSFVMNELADKISTFGNYGRVLNSEVRKSEILTHFRPIYLRMLEACSGNAETALLLLVMTGSSESDVRKLVDKGFACASLEMKATAAHVAAFFHQSDRLPAMERMADSWPKGSFPGSRDLLCRSLTRKIHGGRRM
jgi:hypothetical protein